MKNYYNDYKNQILKIAQHADIDGCGGKQPSLGVACDVFDNNAKVALEGHGDFVECGVARSDKAFWTKAYNARKSVSLSVRRRLQVQFASQFRK